MKVIAVWVDREKWLSNYNMKSYFHIFIESKWVKETMWINSVSDTKIKKRNKYSLVMLCQPLA